MDDEVSVHQVAVVVAAVCESVGHPGGVMTAVGELGVEGGGGLWAVCGENLVYAGLRDVDLAGEYVVRYRSDPCAWCREGAAGRAVGSWR